MPYIIEQFKFRMISLWKEYYFSLNKSLLYNRDRIIDKHYEFMIVVQNRKKIIKSDISK